MKRNPTCNRRNTSGKTGKVANKARKAAAVFQSKKDSRRKNHPAKGGGEGSVLKFTRERCGRFTIRLKGQRGLGADGSSGGQKSI